jgi:hypothetical protein
MKTSLVFALLLTNVLGISQSVCSDEDFIDLCAESLKEYQFLKANKVTLTGGSKTEDSPKAEYSHVLSANTSYIITTCNGAGEGSEMIVELYDRNHVLVMSSYDQQKKKYYNAITFNCTATGVYYFAYFFRGIENGCGIGMLGMKQQAD